MNQNTLDANMVTLGELLAAKYIVPSFQRPYSWDAENINILLNDLYDAFEKRVDINDYNGHFLGTVYLKYKNTIGASTEYDIIDGQQRTTTFALIFLVSYAMFYEFNIDDDEICKDVKNILWKRFGRNTDRNKMLIELGNLDKNLMIKIFNSVLDDPGQFRNFINEHEKVKLSCEKKILKGIKEIFSFITGKFTNNGNFVDKDDFANFVDYILNGTYIVRVVMTSTYKDALAVFESINSKGVSLQSIDIIKSYIFEQLPENEYDHYLGVWSNIIKNTGDRLEDYLKAYIRANVKYFINEIKINNFKNLCANEFVSYFNTNSCPNIVVALLKDMDRNAICYNMLYDFNSIQGNLKQRLKFHVYFSIMLYLKYQHPIAILFKAMTEYKRNKISAEEIQELYRICILFMYVYQTLLNRDSKDALKIFKELTVSYYNKSINVSEIRFFLQEKLNSENITEEIVENNLLNSIGYGDKSAKNEAIVLLSLYESTRNGNVDFSMVAAILQSYKNIYHVDHILPQNPDKNSKYSYYKEIINGTEVLRLKNNADFPADITDGMSYDTFKNRILNKMGNLRIILSGVNLSRQNNMISLPDYGEFITYKQIEERTKNLANIMLNSPIIKL